MKRQGHSVNDESVGVNSIGTLSVPSHCILQLADSSCEGINSSDISIIATFYLAELTRNPHIIQPIQWEKSWRDVPYVWEATSALLNGYRLRLPLTAARKLFLTILVWRMITYCSYLGGIGSSCDVWEVTKVFPVYFMSSV